MKHEDSGMRCCVAHFDDIPGQCMQCKNCGVWLRPGRLDADCPGKKSDKSVRKWSDGGLEKGMGNIRLRQGVLQARQAQPWRAAMR